MNLWSWMKQAKTTVAEAVTAMRRRSHEPVGKEFRSLHEAVHYRDPNVWHSGDVRPFADFVRGRDEGDFR